MSPGTLFNNPTRSVEIAKNTMNDTMTAEMTENPVQREYGQSWGMPGEIDQRAGKVYRSDMELCQDLPMELPPLTRWQERAAFVKQSLKRIYETQKEHGGVFDGRSAAAVLLISKQRLNQLVNSGDIKRVTVRAADGEVLLEGYSARSIREYATRQEPKGGRPKSAVA